MKKILFLIFISLQAFSQDKSIYVEYDVYYNTSSPRVKKSYLGITNNNLSKFIELPEYKLLNNETNEEATEEINTTTININYMPNGVIRKVDINLIEKKITSIETIVFNKIIFKVNETAPQINWNIKYSETKLIGNYECLKATTNFRGRNYIVWYAKEIPLRFGPWKLFGTPGLILEAYDETFKYRWIAKEIKQQNEIFNSITKKVVYDKEITLKEFVDEKYNKQSDRKKFQEKVKSKLPRGAKANFKVNPNRQGKEIIFEWEK